MKRASREGQFPIPLILIIVYKKHSWMEKQCLNASVDGKTVICISQQRACIIQWSAPLQTFTLPATRLVLARARFNTNVPYSILDPNFHREWRIKWHLIRFKELSTNTYTIWTRAKRLIERGKVANFNTSPLMSWRWYGLILNK